MEPFSKYGYLFTHTADCSICGLYNFVSNRSEKCVDCVIKARLTHQKKWRKKNPLTKTCDKKYAAKWYKKMKADPVRYKQWRQSRNNYWRTRRIAENKATLGNLKNELDKNEQQRD